MIGHSSTKVKTRKLPTLHRTVKYLVSDTVFPPDAATTTIGHEPGVVFEPTVQLQDTFPVSSAVPGDRPRAELGPDL